MLQEALKYVTNVLLKNYVVDDLIVFLSRAIDLVTARLAFFTEKKSLKKSYLYEKELPSVLGQTWTLMASSPKKQLSYKDFFGPIAFFAVGMLFSIFMSMYLLQISKDAKGLRALNRRLDAISYLDGLTQIENRRRFDEYIVQELLRAVRTQSAMSVLMIDVDYFKSYNDHYGHVQGDRVLSSQTDGV